MTRLVSCVFRLERMFSYRCMLNACTTAYQFVVFALPGGGWGWRGGGACYKAVKNINLILAGGHVRASAGALAVHTALIPCVCVRVCVCVCVCVRYQTPFSSRNESRPSLFLSTGKHPVGGQLPRVFFSALPGRSSDRPNLSPHKKLSIFQFPFASVRGATSEACSGRGKRRIDRSTSKRSSKKLQRAAITSFFLDRSLVVVHCDRS